MQSLKLKSKDILLKELHELVNQERSLSLKILAYLKEIKSRRIHQELGYSSLFVFCV
ncbi:MAG: hypothetical protein HY072_10130 [Deltaproteobacteria bacterium]|nr:hypothetical protein [Deltaproteobacteria bacterium]